VDNPIRHARTFHNDGLLYAPQVINKCKHTEMNNCIRLKHFSFGKDRDQNLLLDWKMPANEEYILLEKRA
jgi:hypothetical protein